MAKNIKFLSSDGLSYLWDEIRERLFLKVDKIDGKSLSTNDYTDSEKEKLSNIETGSQVNVIESITVNGTNQANSNKTVNISVPTSVSQLTNDSNYQTESQVNSGLALKVDKVTGKSLTSNDFSNDYKTKLDGIESGSQVNNIDNISVNGTRQNISNKTVDISVPTSVSELNNDSHYQTNSEVATAISNATEGKVDKVSGKDLSTNDYTDDEKEKLSGIETSAQVNVIESVSVNGTNQSITNKGINISVPTNNNQLTNGAGYQTASDVSTAINTAIGNSLHLTKEVVVTLPAQGSDNVIYLVPNGKLGSNTKDEYMWINGGWEKTGSSDVDLSGYVRTSDAITNSQIDTIVS